MVGNAAFISVRVQISGRVQGVWFRAWTAEQAERFGLDGWVRNRPDGTVEAMFVGSKPAVEKIVEACHDGPRAARVSEVTVEFAPTDVASGSGFYTLPTE